MAIRKITRVFLLLLITLGQVACQSPPIYPPSPGWTYADLRALDPPDDILPSLDLTALYIRRVGENIEIRLDFLDLTAPPNYDLTLIIEPSLQGDRVTLTILASGKISAQNASGQSLPELQPRISRDASQDTVIISLNRAKLTHNGLPFWVEVFTSAPGVETTSDHISAVRSDGQPPRQTEILLAFWDTFQSATPSQALRSWDGAHTGPERSRHGLHNLLNAVKASSIPVFLLDLKTPQNLSALDFMGAVPLLKKLIAARLLSLPDVDQTTGISQSPTAIFRTDPLGFPENTFLYTPTFPPGYGYTQNIIFVPADGTNSAVLPQHPFRWKAETVIPLPNSSDALASYSATPDGPSLELRRALLQSALKPSPNIFLLGGEFADSSWGDPARVGPTLRYFSDHPWMKFLTADDLLTWRAGSTPGLNSISPPSTPPIQAEILAALQSAPAGPITDQAWEMFLSLHAPAAPDLAQLRTGYMGWVGHLLAAADWAVHPASINDCNIDIDWDGQAECILASPNWFFSFEQAGGYVVLGFVRNNTGIHQIIAPYAQVVVGLSDPSDWKPGLGSEGDPGLVPGGFVDQLGPWHPEVQPGRITFTDETSKRHKVFRLLPDGLQVDYQTDTPANIEISLALDPWLRFTSGWGDRYQNTTITDGWVWGIHDEIEISINTTGSITADPFTESRPYLSLPEDPNFDYPPGHSIPFAFTRVEIKGQGNFTIRISTP